MGKPIYEILRNGIVKITSSMNAIATFWIFIMMLLMTGDVLGRILLNHPITGTPEIIKVSIVGIVFLQMPHALWMNRHIRSELTIRRLSAVMQELLKTITNIIGMSFFIGIFFACWGYTVTSWQLLEFVGEGALRVPVYPVRTIILLGSVLTAIVYAIQAYQSIQTIIKTRQGKR